MVCSSSLVDWSSSFIVSSSSLVDCSSSLVVSSSSMVDCSSSLVVSSSSLVDCSSWVYRQFRDEVLDLPRIPKQDKSVTISNPSRLADEPMLALLVDRDQDTRQMYAEYLKLGNWQVEEASDGREALAKAITLRPDVIVTETRLPGIDGITLCGLLRRDVATSTIPVVFVTGDAYSGGHRAGRGGRGRSGADQAVPSRTPARGAAQRPGCTRASLRAPRRALVQTDARHQLAHADEVFSRAVDTVLPPPHAEESASPGRHHQPARKHRPASSVRRATGRSPTAAVISAA